MGMQSRITDKWNLFRKDPRDACKALFHLVWQPPHLKLDAKGWAKSGGEQPWPDDNTTPSLLGDF